jgi:hypothetical protein
MPSNFRIPPITPEIVEAYARMQRAQEEWSAAQANLEAAVGGLPLEFHDFEMTPTDDHEAIMDTIELCIDQELVDLGVGRYEPEEEDHA